MDFAALKTDFVGGGGSAPLYFARPPLAAFAFRLTPIGQTKILRDQAVSVVNSPQVSIYFDYLFIYFSEYFYCAFFFSFLFFLFLFSYCTAHALVQVLSVVVQRDTAPCKNVTVFKGIVHPICILHVFVL